MNSLRNLDMFAASSDGAEQEIVTRVRLQAEMNVWLVGQQASPTQRRNRYVVESYSHPAKMLPELARRVIETYTRSGDFVVDVMSGIGTTGVEAIWLDRRYTGIEIEPEYAELQIRNLELAESQGAGSGWEVILGDSRDDHGLTNIDLIALSPPYQDAIHNQGNELARIQRKIASGQASPELVRRFGNWDESSEQALAGTRSAGYSANSANIGHSKGNKYWAAMHSVYERAYHALRPGGYLAIVTKDQRDRKSGELTNLYGETVECCRSIGFLLHQHIVAILCKIDLETGVVTYRTSHWQRMAMQKSANSDRVILMGQFEDVAVFRKPQNLGAND